MAHDDARHCEMLLLSKLVRAHTPRSVDRLFFDETDPLDEPSGRSVASPAGGNGMALRRPAGNPAGPAARLGAYVPAEERADAHQRWGVLHLARFSVEGAATRAAAVSRRAAPATAASSISTRALDSGAVLARVSGTQGSWSRLRDTGRVGFCRVTAQGGEGDCFKGSGGSRAVRSLEPRAPTLRGLDDCIGYCRTLCPRCITSRTRSRSRTARGFGGATSTRCSMPRRRLRWG